MLREARVKRVIVGPYLQGHLAAISQPKSWGRVTSSLKRGLFHNNPLREFLPPRVENDQPHFHLLEAVAAGWVGQANDSRERQLLPADPPDKGELLGAFGAACNGEGHAVILPRIGQAGSA